MTKEPKPNYKINQGCSNCRHNRDLQYGRIYCNIDCDFPGVNAYIWPKWRDSHEVHDCGVCDNWGY